MVIAIHKIWKEEEEEEQQHQKGNKKKICGCVFMKF